MKKLFTARGLDRALVLLAVELRRLAWTGLALAGLLFGADQKVATLVVAVVVWLLAQAAAFAIVALTDDGNDTS